MHPQRVRNPAVSFLLAHPTPAGIVKGAARMVMVGAHGESPTVRLGRFRRGIFSYSCVFSGREMHRTYDAREADMRGICMGGGLAVRADAKVVCSFSLGPFGHLLWTPPARCANCPSSSSIASARRIGSQQREPQPPGSSQSRLERQQNPYDGIPNTAMHGLPCAGIIRSRQHPPQRAPCTRQHSLSLGNVCLGIARAVAAFASRQPPN